MIKETWNALWGEQGDENYEKSAHIWFQIAKVSAAITILFFLCAASSVLAQRDADAAQKLAQSFSPFFVGAMAAVTFCTIIWRGKITSEQSKQQKRQNDAKDEENLGKLLIDGTKLLGEKQESHVVAGIAALQAVAASPTKTFSTSAMDILVDIVEKNYADDERSNIYLAARRAVNAGARADNKSTRSIVIDMEKVGSRVLPKIKGVRKITAINGEITAMSYKFLTEQTFFGLQKVKVSGATVGTEAKFVEGCVFRRCRITAFSLGFVDRNEFIQCDFSDAQWTSSLNITSRYRPKFENLKDKGNFYDIDRPIKSNGNIDWAQYLLVETDGSE